MSENDKKPVSLSTMLGNGTSFEVNGKIYTIKPIALKDIEDFMKDNLSLGSQLFNVADKKAREKINRWLTGYCFDEDGNSTGFEKVSNDGWDVVDLKEFIKKLCDFSG